MCIVITHAGGLIWSQHCGHELWPMKSFDGDATSCPGLFMCRACFFKGKPPRTTPEYSIKMKFHAGSAVFGPPESSEDSVVQHHL